jgi:hypothetical protein
MNHEIRAFTLFRCIEYRCRVERQGKRQRRRRKFLRSTIPIVGVYLIVSRRTGDLKYIGSSTNVIKRLRKQVRDFSLTRHRFYWTLVDHDQRMNTEAALIRNFDPLFNITSGGTPKRDAEILASFGLSKRSDPPRLPGSFFEIPRAVKRHRETPKTVKRQNDAPLKANARIVGGRHGTVHYEPRRTVTEPEPEDIKLLLRLYGAIEREFRT